MIIILSDIPNYDIMVKVLPIGYEDFSEVRNEDVYYIDKTELIGQIIDVGAKVCLFTRPRRFGKSLNQSMLNCFFNRKFKDNSWFDGLKVSTRRDLDVHKNAYPVINIDMKDLKDVRFVRVQHET